jgi:hypothetical protein
LKGPAGGRLIVKSGHLDRKPISAGIDMMKTQKIGTCLRDKNERKNSSFERFACGKIKIGIEKSQTNRKENHRVPF